MLTQTTTTPVYELTTSDKKFIGWHILFAVTALTVGSLFGPLQALEHAGVNWYPSIDFLFIEFNGVNSYYQGLTLHGVLNALIWTTFFITGFSTLAVIRGLKRGLAIPLLGQLAAAVRAFCWSGCCGDSAAGQQRQRALHVLPTDAGGHAVPHRPVPGGRR